MTDQKQEETLRVSKSITAITNHLMLCFVSELKNKRTVDETIANLRRIADQKLNDIEVTVEPREHWITSSILEICRGLAISIAMAKISDFDVMHILLSIEQMVGNVEDFEQKKSRKRTSEG